MWQEVRLLLYIIQTIWLAASDVQTRGRPLTRCTVSELECLYYSWWWKHKCQLKWPKSSKLLTLLFLYNSNKINISSSTQLDIQDPSFIFRMPGCLLQTEERNCFSSHHFWPHLSLLLGQIGCIKVFCLNTSTFNLKGKNTLHLSWKLLTSVVVLKCHFSFLLPFSISLLFYNPLY